jgi:hypothetical protein
LAQLGLQLVQLLLQIVLAFAPERAGLDSSVGRLFPNVSTSSVRITSEQRLAYHLGWY